MPRQGALGVCHGGGGVIIVDVSMGAQRQHAPRGRGSGDDLASRNNNAISSSSSSSSSGGGGNNPLGEALLGDRGEDGEEDVDNDSGGMVGSGIISIDADVQQEDPPSFPAAGDSGQPPPLPPPSQQQAAVPWRIIVFTWQCWPVYVQHFW